MKVYDGAGLIADKSEAAIVPVRIDGLEQTPFTRLEHEQVRRRWFPKVVVTILEPVKLAIDPALKGRKRRQAARRRTLRRHVGPRVPHDLHRPHRVEALIQAAHRHGMNHVALEDPVSGTLSYRKLLLGVAVLGRKLMDFAAEGRPVGVMLPNANGAAVTLFALMSAGRVPAMINFTAGAANVLAACSAADIKVILTARAFIEKARLRHSDRRDRGRCADRLSRRHRVRRFR